MRDRFEEAAEALIRALGLVQGLTSTQDIDVRPEAIGVKVEDRVVDFPRLPTGRIAMASEVYSKGGGRLDSALFFQVCDVVARAVGAVPVPAAASPYLKTDRGIPGRSTRSILTLQALKELQDLAARAAGMALRENGPAKVAHWHEGRHGVRVMIVEHDAKRLMICLSLNGAGSPTSVAISDVGEDSSLSANMALLRQRKMPDPDIAVAFSPATVVKGTLDDMAFADLARHVIEQYQRRQPSLTPPRPLMPQRGPRHF